MKLKLITLTLIIFSGWSIQGQNEPTPPVTKESYKILKIDALNLMGLGVQKLHVSYEISPLTPNKTNLPTFNINLNVPLATTSEMNINYGMEVGGELRFYQLRRHQNTPLAEGLFLGVGLDGGFVKFNRPLTYFNSMSQTYQNIDMEYNRTRTGIYFLMGGASKIGEKLYFETSFGIGWSNANVQAQNEINIANFNKQYDDIDDNILYLNYWEGKGQRFYMPVNMSLGYNFGEK